MIKLNTTKAATSEDDAKKEDAVKHLYAGVKPHAPNISQIYHFGVVGTSGLGCWLEHYLKAGNPGALPKTLIAKLLQDLDKQRRKMAKTRQVKPNDLTSFEETLALRKCLQAFLDRYEKYRPALARWIVQEWGKVDKISDDNRGAVKTFAKYKVMVRDAEIWNAGNAIPRSFGHKNVPQWSKYLAFRFPDKAAIYDSRVVHTLNWYLRNAMCAKPFPRHTSRNTLVTLLDHTIIRAIAHDGWPHFRKMVLADISELERGQKKSGILKDLEKSWGVIPKRDAYEFYLRVLNPLSEKLFKKDGWALTKTEMLLFGLATIQVSKEVLEKYSRVGPADLLDVERISTRQRSSKNSPKRLKVALKAASRDGLGNRKESWRVRPHPLGALIG